MMDHVRVLQLACVREMTDKRFKGLQNGGKHR